MTYFSISENKSLQFSSTSLMLLGRLVALSDSIAETSREIPGHFDFGPLLALAQASARTVWVRGQPTNILLARNLHLWRFSCTSSSALPALLSLSFPTYTFAISLVLCGRTTSLSDGDGRLLPSPCCTECCFISWSSSTLLPDRQDCVRRFLSPCVDEGAV